MVGEIGRVRRRWGMRGVVPRKGLLGLPEMALAREDLAQPGTAVTACGLGGKNCADCVTGGYTACVAGTCQ